MSSPVMEVILRAIDQVSGTIDGITSKVESAGAKMNQVGDSMVGGGIAMSSAVTAPMLGVAKVVQMLSSEAMGYEKQMAEVFTLLPGISQTAMDSMSKDVLSFSKDFGVLPEQAVPALYQALSAGVPPDNVFDFLEVGQKAALGGVTDLTTAVDGITSVVNAFGADTVSASKASDLMFTSVKLGKTTFDELSRSLFNVNPIASALGVEFGDVTAALASMTAQGVPTSVATTQLRQLFVELSKEGGQAAKTFGELSGKSFKEFIAEGGNVADALAIMNEHAVNTGVGVNDLFGSVEAGSAALALSGENAEGYISNIDAMAQAAGATEEAFAVMEGTASHATDKATAAWAAMKTEAGDKFLPILVDTLIPILQNTVMPALERFFEFIGNAAVAFGNLSAPMQTLILGFLALVTAIGPVMIYAGMVVKAMGTLLPLVTKIGPAVKIIGAVLTKRLVPGMLLAVKAAWAFTAALLANPITWIVLAIVALIAAIVLLWKNWDQVSAWLIGAWEAIKEKASEIWGGLTEFFATFWEGVKDVFSAAWEFIKDLFFKYHPLGWVITNWEGIKEWFSGFWDGLKNVFTIAFEFIKGLFFKYHPLGWIITNWEPIVQWMTDFWNRLKEFFTGAWEALKAIFITSTEGIRTTITSAFETVRDWIVNVWNKISEFFTGIWGKIKEMFSGSLTDILTRIGMWQHNLYQKAIDAGKKLLSGFMDNVKDLPGKLWEVMKNAVSKLMNIGGELWNAAKSAGSKIWSGIKNGLGMKSPGYIEKAIDGIAERASKLPGEMARSFSSIKGLDVVPNGPDLAFAGGFTGSKVQEYRHNHTGTIRVLGEDLSGGRFEQIVEIVKDELRREVRG